MAMESAAARTKIPCAACRILRWRCTKCCILSPHFPPTEPEKFVAVHWVFGANNVSKMLQEIPIADRGDAVTSMVYEAKARLADPVYGCVAFVEHQVSHLQSELNAALAEAMVLRAQLLEALSTCPIHSQPQDAARISKQRDLEAQSCFWEWSGTWGEEFWGQKIPCLKSPFGWREKKGLGFLTKSHHRNRNRPIKVHHFSPLLFTQISDWICLSFRFPPFLTIQRGCKCLSVFGGALLFLFLSWLHGNSCTTVQS